MFTEKIDVLITKEEIEKRVKELARQIEEDYWEDKDLVCVGLFKGVSII